VNIFIAGGNGCNRARPRAVARERRTQSRRAHPLRRAHLATRANGRCSGGRRMCTTRCGSLDWSRSPKRRSSSNQLTAFGTTDGDPYAETIRVRIEGTRNLVSAARAARVRRFIAQSISFMCSPFGSGLTDEETPLHLDAPAGFRALAEAIASLERQTLDASAMSGTFSGTAGSTALEPATTLKAHSDRYSQGHDCLS